MGALMNACRRTDHSSRPFFLDGLIGMNPHDGLFWDTIARDVDVYSDDIKELSKDAVVLSSGTRVDPNAILLGTGCDSSIDFFSLEEKQRLGLPFPKSKEGAMAAKEWNVLEAEADRAIVKRFPALRQTPIDLSDQEAQRTATWYRLYSSIMPITDHSIAFPGTAIVANQFRSAEFEAKWITAMFDGHVKLPDESMRKKLLLLRRFREGKIPPLALEK
jgi:dimethylaniline monooxygenase (N-oxide forming)